MPKAKPGTISAQSLAAVDAFAAETLIARTQIAALFQGRRYARGEQIIGLKGREGGVYFLISGTVLVTYFAANGREVAFRELAAGDMFGELSALDDGPRSAQVLALSNTFIGWLSSDHFRHLLQQHPGFSAHVIQRLVKLVRLLSERVVEMSTLGVINRIHVELLRLAWKAGVQGNRAVIRPSPNQEQMASRISTRREAVSKEFSALEARGIVTRNGARELVINDMHQLEDLVHAATG